MWTLSDDLLEFIPLDRTFHEISTRANESDEVDISRALYGGERLSWSDLLKNYRLVILSEAGSGKTEEIRHAALRLRSDGKDAFFLRLENITEHFDVAFEVGSLAEFESWLETGREGWILLDSVDEARLRHVQDFELAIRRLGDKLALALDRTHIVLTGRTSAWRPKTDLDKCSRYLPFVSSQNSSSDSSGEESDVTSDIADEILAADNDDGIEPSSDRPTSTEADESQKPVSQFKIVTLDGLTRDQVELFARRRGIKDISEFSFALEQADAWSFTSRPQDLEDLIAFWLDKSEIGGRLQIMKNSVERRLKERDQNRADILPLSHDRAYDGALLLAAATTLGNNPAIQVLDGAEAGLGRIHVDRILPDWTPNEIAALLQRPIFDAALYGAQRFHHRSVREYLTAIWLCRMLKHPTSRRPVEDMFFKRQYGVEIVVPTMRPVLPWMALFDENIRGRLQRTVPEVLFEGGDPAQLPLSVRKQILENVTAEIARNETPRSPTDHAAVQRFANRDIGPDIRRLLQTYARNQNAASFLLRMVWLGRISDALPEAKQHALDASGGTYQRIAAFRAVDKIGDLEEIREIRESFLAEPAPLSRMLLGEIISLLSDDVEIPVGWLLSAVEKTAPPARYTVDHLAANLSNFVAALNIDLLADVADGFGRLLSREPFKDKRHYRVSQKFSWLLEPASKALERLILARHPVALSPVSLRTLQMLHGSKHFDNDIREIRSDLSKLVPEWPELNRASFWAAAEEAQKGVGGQPLTNPWQVGIFGSFWSFSAADFDYFCDQIAIRSSMPERLMALSLAFDSYALGGRQRASYVRLRTAVGGDNELAARLDMLLNPPPRDETTNLERRWKREAKARERREKVGRAKSREYVMGHIAELRDPKFPNPNDLSKTQWYLHHRMRDSQKDSGKWTSGQWRSLVPEFGEEAARAFRDGAVAYWRRADTPTKSEGDAANQTTAAAIFGLTGLAIDARETPNWAQNLSPQEALRASRFASHELNGFPTWFPALYVAHPKVVGDFLMHELKYELEAEPDEGMHYIIDDLSWSGKWAWADLGPRIFELLKDAEPRNNETLDKLLQMVLASRIPNEEIAALGSARAIGKDGPKHASTWFAVWAGVDPDHAIPALEKYLNGLPDEDAQTEVAMGFVTRLFGGDRYSYASVARTAYQRPAVLKELYVMMYRYIRRADDIDRTNGEAYSPTLRDRAQDARNSIVAVLKGIPGKEAYFAMMEIAKSETEPSTRAWIEYRAHQKAEQEGNISPWTPEQVRDFNAFQERTPQTHRELAELAVNRILDLKSDLENGETSVAAILQSVKDETEMRAFIGRELREKGAGRYSIQIADAQRTGLTFYRTEIEEPVAVELRLAEKWTGAELFECLENQPAGKYLSDRRFTSGIFLLVHQNEYREWKLPDGSDVDFEGLLGALKEHWKSLSARYPNVEELVVIGIDLDSRFVRADAAFNFSV
ncbi:hypothetical protein [Mesorhizobium sp.]|uniref:hypothetical protein n=1 Tax=Mesorhizobium sp. TaxID=1871066 RepID=UPI0012108FF1|nr:hypothetical protein [Mesorhizobium sp.]TJV19666.1 MAG: hypothetical protein E5Y07_00285 [Mesorhizobium sp.]